MVLCYSIKRQLLLYPLSTKKLPAEELTTNSSTELQEVPTRELNTDQAQVVGVNRDFGGIKVLAEFVKEDLCTPEEIADDGFNLESIDLTDVCDDDNELITKFNFW